VFIKSGDPAYNEWNDRGVNLRFKGSPLGIIPVSSIDELAQALQESIDQGLHVVVRGGGHCLENFVAAPSVQVIIDISRIKGVRHDPEKKAIEVMAGETTGEMLRKLYEQWRIVLPVGEHPDIGMGGHIAGGAFGFLCRQHGLAVDYLYAVEILWVNENRKVEKIVATREADDQNRELWWAHTGGGTGNFGIVTRYWFRSATTTGVVPSALLPRAPGNIETLEIDWSWNDVDESSFHRLVKNFGRWVEENSGEGISARSFFGTLHLWNKVTGKLQLKGLVTDPAHADYVIKDLIPALHQGLDIPHRLSRKKISWLEFALNPFPDIFPPGKGAFKFKDAFLLKPFTDQQIRTVYRYVTERTDTPGGSVGMATYGGKVNTVASGETASAQRSAIFTMSCTPGWTDPAEAEKYMDWSRSCYRDLFAETGGAPVPGTRTGGCIIAHPDNDLADPAWNNTGIPWHAFYYQDNYPRLQRIKATWDPLNIFHHALSIQPATVYDPQYST
jgi:aclacinomycin oxidase